VIGLVVPSLTTLFYRRFQSIFWEKLLNERDVAMCASIE
jgi:hypothetical protein